MKFSNTRNGTPARWAPAISRSAPSRVVATGFCSETALPAANAASAASTCKWCGSRISHQVDLLQRQQLVKVGGNHRVLHPPSIPAALRKVQLPVTQRHDRGMRIVQVLDGRSEIRPAPMNPTRMMSKDQPSTGATRRLLGTAEEGPVRPSIWHFRQRPILSPTFVAGGRGPPCDSEYWEPHFLRGTAPTVTMGS